jgi:hypothetical protein
MFEMRKSEQIRNYSRKGLLVLWSRYERRRIMRREYVKIKQSVYDELIEIKAKYVLMLKVFEMLNIQTPEDKDKDELGGRE